MSCKAGEAVTFEFTSADATTAAAVTIKDGNNVTRTLGAEEQLWIDTASAALAAAVLTADLFSDNANSGVVDANELIASFGPNTGMFDGGDEGFACHKGVTPKVKGSNAGVVRVTGTGRIRFALGRTTRPTWKQSGG
jgi:hypothetical protein